MHFILFNPSSLLRFGTYCVSVSLTFNISVDGSSAAEISRKGMAIKDSVSPTIKAMEEKEMVISKNNKCSKLLSLTFAGKKIVLGAHLKIEKLTQDDINLVGEQDLKIAIDVIMKVINYHESLNESHEELED